MPLLPLLRAGRGGLRGPTAGADGRQVYAFGSATLVKFDQWTWAVAVGDSMRAHLTQVALGGARAFSRDLLEFGPRIGLLYATNTFGAIARVRPNAMSSMRL